MALRGGCRSEVAWPEGGRTRPTMPAFSPTSAQPGLELFPGCMESCSCPSDDFNPVCDSSSRVEYITPCHAGCRSRVVQEAPDKSQVGQASGCPPPLIGSALSVSVCLSHPPPLNILILWLFCLSAVFSFCWQIQNIILSISLHCQSCARAPSAEVNQIWSQLSRQGRCEGSNSGIPGVVTDRSGPHKDNQ